VKLYLHSFHTPSWRGAQLKRALEQLPLPHIIASTAATFKLSAKLKPTNVESCTCLSIVLNYKCLHWYRRAEFKLNPTTLTQSAGSTPTGIVYSNTRALLLTGRVNTTQCRGGRYLFGIIYQMTTWLYNSTLFTVFKNYKPTVLRTKLGQ